MKITYPIGNKQEEIARKMLNIVIFLGEYTCLFTQKYQFFINS